MLTIVVALALSLPARASWQTRECLPGDVGTAGGYDQSYAYAQQPAEAQVPPSNGSWYSQYQNNGTAADYGAAGYSYPQTGQATAYNSLSNQPPPPPSEVPPPPTA